MALMLFYDERFYLKKKNLSYNTIKKNYHDIVKIECLFETIRKFNSKGKYYVVKIRFIKKKDDTLN